MKVNTEIEWYDNILQHWLDKNKPVTKNTALCKCLFCSDIIRRKKEKDIDEYID